MSDDFKAKGYHSKSEMRRMETMKHDFTKCNWCGADGVLMGDAKSFPGSQIAKCTKCHHEWQVPGSQVDSFKK